MDKDNSARIEDILKEIRELKKQHEKRAATGEFFNVFLIAGVKIDEDRHSAILADLLNPNGSHRQKAVFLKHFLNLELLGLADSFDYSELKGFHVERKANRKDGEIDVLLEKKDDACIIIENKIHDAVDQDNQLNKYYKYAKESFTDDQIKLIYLTRDGREPNKNSLRGKDGKEDLDIGRVICMSYERAILKWLEDCLEEVKAAKATPIREVLFQYQEQIKNLTDLPTKEDCSMNNKIISILADNYDLFVELNNSITKVKKRRRDEFFEKLKGKIKDEVCGIKILGNKKARITAKVSIFNSDQSLTMILQVGGEKNLWYGFEVHKEGRDVSKHYKGHFKKHLNLTTDWKTNSGLGWKDLKYQDQPVSFPDYVTEQMHYIFDDNELEKMVGEIAQEIKDEVNKFRKAKEDAGL